MARRTHSHDGDSRGRKLRFEALESRQMLAGVIGLVKDINAVPTFPSNPNNLVDVSGTAFFYANDGVRGYELWKSDGTEAGTVLVKEVLAGASDPFIRNLTNVSGTLYFTIPGNASISGLWKSNGTAAGTVRVSAVGGGSSFGVNHTNVGGTLFYTAADAGGEELWKSNGTAAGTVRVKDIVPGTGGSSPRYITDVGGVAYFVANDGVSGFELWKSDGTSAGTVRVKDIRAGSASSQLKYLTNVNGTLYFRALETIRILALVKSVKCPKILGLFAFTTLEPRDHAFSPSTPCRLPHRPDRRAVDDPGTVAAAGG